MFLAALPSLFPAALAAVLDASRLPPCPCGAAPVEQAVRMEGYAAGGPDGKRAVRIYECRACARRTTASVSVRLAGPVSVTL